MKAENDHFCLSSMPDVRPRPPAPTPDADADADADAYVRTHCFGFIEDRTSFACP